MSISREATSRITRSGLIATLLLLIVVLVCIRLGFWQLARRAERIALNDRIAARMQQPPVQDPALLTDTANYVFRTAELAGAYDAERSIVLPGRALQGAPGVHLLTPFRVNGTQAVLVNRGWLPSPDAATISIDSFPIAGTRARGLVLPFPGRQSSRGAVRDAVADSGFRRVWFTIDAQALRAQFPYELLPFTLQLLPSADAPTRPRRLAPPPLDQGPHLSYAIQWFSFALIGVIGWFALMRRRGRGRVAPPLPLVVLAFAALTAWPARAQAQLRPFDPFEWRILDDSTDLLGSVGAGVNFTQPAALAGASGRLLELGMYRLVWRSGRIGLDFAGTAYWHFTEQDSLEAPAPGVEPTDDRIRQDPGPAAASAFVRISPARWANTDLLLRFGARIPTTSLRTGLERDETDFFALFGGQWQTGSWALAGEAGVGIHGSVRPGYQQSDVLVFNAGAQRRMGVVAASASIVGHVDGHDWRVRGNEDQAELRLGLRAGRTRWLQATYVRGLADFSPEHAVQLAIGFVTDCATDCLP